MLASDTSEGGEASPDELCLPLLSWVVQAAVAPVEACWAEGSSKEADTSECWLMERELSSVASSLPLHVSNSRTSPSVAAWRLVSLVLSAKCTAVADGFLVLFCARRRDALEERERADRARRGRGAGARSS